MRKIWTNEEIGFLKENYGILSAPQMAMMLNRSTSSVRHKLERCNIESPKIWADEEILFLKENYKTMTYKELAQQLGRSKAAIDLKANRLGLKKSKYHYNHDYFENIDSEEKAYWCGFIMADGNIWCNDSINSCELSIKLRASDKKHLQKFNQSLQGNVPVEEFDVTCSFTDKISHQVQIRLYSEKIFHDIQKYGVIPNKSLTKQFPKNIPDELIRHYIRGYYDGNGWITQHREYIDCGICSGSEDFIKGLMTQLNHVGIPTGNYYKDKRSHCYRFQLRSMQTVNSFLHYIYDDTTVYLDRKYNKFQKIYKKLNYEQRLLR